MKKFLGLILLILSVNVCAAPTTTVKVTHPTTAAMRNPPRTNPTGDRPTTGVKVEHPETVVVVTHPTTPGVAAPTATTGFASAKATDKAAPKGPEGTKSAASYTPSYKNAKKLGDNKGNDNIPQAAKLVKGEGGMGLMTATDKADKDKAAAEEEAHQKELKDKKQEMLKEVMGKMEGAGGKIAGNILKNVK